MCNVYVHVFESLRTGTDTWQLTVSLRAKLRNSVLEVRVSTPCTVYRVPCTEYRIPYMHPVVVMVE